MRKIILFLNADGVGTSRAVRINKTYRDGAVATIMETPYRLARNIRGIGIKTIAEAAMRLGITKGIMVRVPRPRGWISDMWPSFFYLKPALVRERRKWERTRQVASDAEFANP